MAEIGFHQILSVINTMYWLSYDEILPFSAVYMIQVGGVSER